MVQYRGRKWGYTKGLTRRVWWVDMTNLGRTKREPRNWLPIAPRWYPLRYLFPRLHQGQGGGGGGMRWVGVKWCGEKVIQGFQSSFQSNSKGCVRKTKCPLWATVAFRVSDSGCWVLRGCWVWRGCIWLWQSGRRCRETVSGSRCSEREKVIAVWRGRGCRRYALPAAAAASQSLLVLVSLILSVQDRLDIQSAKGWSGVRGRVKKRGGVWLRKGEG